MAVWSFVCNLCSYVYFIAINYFDVIAIQTLYLNVTVEFAVSHDLIYVEVLVGLKRWFMLIIYIFHSRVVA